MQLFALLLITVLDYASSDPAHCYVTFMDSQVDNPYIDVTVDGNYYVDTLDILKELTNDDGLKLLTSSATIDETLGKNIKHSTHQLLFIIPFKRYSLINDGIKRGSVVWDVVDQQALDTDEESMDLCSSSPSDAEAAHLEILRQALGLDSMNCPIQPTSVKKPPTLFDCEYDFGDTEDSAAFLDFWIEKDETHICDVAVTILKPADDHSSDEK